MSDEVVVACRELSCGYGDRVILEGIDLDIGRGEIVTILGGSGSGKSTLLRTLVGLEPPLRGRVDLFGERLHQEDGTPRTELLRRTGMLFQSDALFGSMTVLDNVGLPLRETTSLPRPVREELARAKLRLVDLAGLGDRRPSELSGGQRKRVALARASVLDPEVIFCDEPSSGLDPIVAAQLDQTLLRFREVLGLTVIAVTHELGSIRCISDRAVMLADGGVAQVGPIEELADSEKPHIRRFFARQAPEERSRKTLLDDIEEVA